MTILASAPLGRTTLTAPTVVHVSGDIDIFTSHALRTRLLNALPYGSGRLVVDLSAVAFCDASGLGVLVGIQHRASRRGVAFALRGPRPQLRKLLRVTGLDRSLRIVV
ncbi:STAS domain-containing protein [Nonomuraea muscovyensis]|uniref:Anti-sigma factor antagonist n=1 Tax=Nonomuraea muscovyensis TaxID=1124761 RepID=A0A7X0C493_9ACTN|nr:STAS domain-containing protein [Nonomuraea muscovyensis]MBB6348127.1 anti-sigma B factor antagonist [Nonomuraea muscovyensis]